MLTGNTVAISGSAVVLVDASTFDGEYVAHVKVTAGSVRLGDSSVNGSVGYLLANTDDALVLRVQGESLYGYSGGANVDVLVYSA